MDAAPERWAKVRAILEEALDLPPDERSAFVARATQGDERLTAEVEELLRLDTGTEDTRLGLPEPEILGGWLEEHMGRVLAGKRIGSFRLRRILGYGGMGTVYEAEQDSPRRVVALKMMRLGLGAPAALRRFRWEIDVLARLRHPAIAQVYEAGVHVEHIDGHAVEVPYFAMERVEGARTLLRFAEEERLDVRARLRLFVAVCHGVQEGHRRGLIHRDLKPGNLLVDCHGHAKIIDFGVARAMRDEPHRPFATMTGETIGTLRYMSPEQLAGDPEDVDVRTDVYSLGIVLYELLSGQPPYADRNAPLAQLAGVLRSEAPVPLGTRDPRLRGDLERIAQKAMHHDRAQRYESAGDLAADVERWLAGLPVEAGPPGSLYRLRKLVARHRVAVAGALLALLGLVAGTVVATAAWLEAREQRRIAEEEARQAAAITDFLSDVLVAAHPWHDGPDVTLREVVIEAGARIDERFADAPGVAVVLHETVAATLASLGRFQEAAHHFGRAIAIDELYACRAAETAMQTRHEYGGLLFDLGRFDEAAYQLRRVIAWAEATPGAGRSLLAARNLHAAVLGRLGRHDDAVRELRKSLDDAEQRFGPDAIETLGHVNSLGQVLADAGRFAEAEPLTRRAFDTMLERFGAEHPSTLVTMLNHAAVLTGLGRATEAEPLLQEVLARRSALLGEAHPYTRMTRQWLARALTALGRYAEAEEALQIAVEELPADAPDDARGDLTVDIAIVRGRAGRREEAEAVLGPVVAGTSELRVSNAFRERARAELQRLRTRESLGSDSGHR